MTPLLFTGLAVAGGIGAALRLLIDGIIRSQLGTRLPWGTITINTSGSLLLGLLTGLSSAGDLPTAWTVVLGTGLLGGYTTFSTASIETVRLLQERRSGAALANGIGMLVLAVAAAFGGYELGVAL